MEFHEKAIYLAYTYMDFSSLLLNVFFQAQIVSKSMAAGYIRVTDFYQKMFFFRIATKTNVLGTMVYVFFWFFPLLLYITLAGKCTLSIERRIWPLWPIWPYHFYGVATNYGGEVTFL